MVSLHMLEDTSVYFSFICTLSFFLTKQRNRAIKKNVQPVVASRYPFGTQKFSACFIVQGLDEDKA
jgi:hypothetical protein